MAARVQPSSPHTPFKALDACHQEMERHLTDLTALAQALDEGEPGPQARRTAGVIEHFFSTTSRAHHVQEEESVFPALLESGDPRLVTAVRSLQQDHGWIEENWLVLAPQLRALASGNGWLDPTEFQHAVALFVALCTGHVALEESLVYPESKARWSHALAARSQRLGP